jgi:hypothetical protein
MARVDWLQLFAGLRFESCLSYSFCYTKISYTDCQTMFSFASFSFSWHMRWGGVTGLFYGYPGYGDAAHYSTRLLSLDAIYPHYKNSPSSPLTKLARTIVHYIMYGSLCQIVFSY